jgi:tetratricopeptide (TPR) repeat protein
LSGVTDTEFSLMHQLNAVLGWLELGDVAEAREELQRIPEPLRSRSEVLEIRWILDAHKGDWEDALEAAEALVEAAPEKAVGWLHRAYAVRRVPNGGLEKAAEALRPAVDKFPEEATIPYNLACYACQMQQSEQAREWLAEAVRRGGAKKIKKMALSDADLEPLWPEIKKLH